MTAFLMIFRRFPTTFRRFSKIVPKARRAFPNIFWEFLKISEDVRRLPKTFKEDPKMFRWYTNEFKYNLRDKLDITEVIDIFTCEDFKSSHVRISYHFYQFVTTRYTTDFYIIICFICSLLSQVPGYFFLPAWCILRQVFSSVTVRSGGILKYFSTTSHLYVLQGITVYCFHNKTWFKYCFCLWLAADF